MFASDLPEICPVINMTITSLDLSEEFLENMVFRADKASGKAKKIPKDYALNDTILIDPSGFTGLYPESFQLTVTVYTHSM
jgi:hypothetical protein